MAYRAIRGRALRSRLVAFLFASVLGCSPEPKKREAPPSEVARDASVIDIEAIAYATAGPSASGPVAVARSEMLLSLDCLTCHDELLLKQQRLSAQQWHETITKMQKWGSQIAERDIPGISEFLAERYGPNAGAFVPKPVAIAELQAKIGALPDEGLGGGDSVRGKSTFQKYCLDCHGADAKGGSLGIRLVDSPLLSRAPDIVKTIRTGRGRMGPVLSLEGAEIRDIIAYLRSKQREEPGL